MTTESVPMLSQETEKETGATLQTVLSDLLLLALSAKQAHWNVVGPHFHTIHTQLDALADDLRAQADIVAERMRAIGIPADGQAEFLARQAQVTALPRGLMADREVAVQLATRLADAAARARAGIDALGSLDLPSQDIVIAVVQVLEHHHWMFRAQQA